MKIGVLALQGAFREHLVMLEHLGVEGVKVRQEEDLDALDGLILPGGESTAMGKMLQDLNLKDPLIRLIKSGLPVWGTCAGLILLAKDVEGQSPHLALMDIKTKRNAYGSQLDSFNKEVSIPHLFKTPFPLIFIRAPIIESCGSGVEVLYELDHEIVAVKEKNMLVTSFHPELSGDTRWHQYFIKKICQKYG